MLSEIKEKIRELPKEYIALLFTSPENYVVLYYDVLKLLVNDLDYAGVIITINKPARVLVSNLKDKDIEIKNINIIDCISNSVGVNKEVDNTIYIDTPSNLNKLNISIKKQLKELKDKEKTFLMFDSLTTLLLYNSTGSVLKFINYLTTRMKSSGVGGVFITVEEGLDKKFVNQVIQFCDDVIRT
ncbi:MAG: ATPase domain-containing protein [Candidatus Aenigmatarchaeota archaeon]